MQAGSLVTIQPILVINGGQPCSSEPTRSKQKQFRCFFHFAAARGMLGGIVLEVDVRSCSALLPSVALPAFDDNFPGAASFTDRG